jgi:hypothetical protein
MEPTMAHNAALKIDQARLLKEKEHDGLLGNIRQGVDDATSEPPAVAQHLALSKSARQAHDGQRSVGYVSTGTMSDMHERLKGHGAHLHATPLRSVTVKASAGKFEVLNGSSNTQRGGGNCETKTCVSRR